MPLNYFHLLLAVLLLIHVSGIEAGVSAIIVFGDSSVDAGNNDFIDTVAKSNFDPYGRDFNGGVATGRFTNGLLATDYFSQYFGLSQTIPAYLDPNYSIKDFASGVCFASAASGYDNATADVLSVLPLWKQVENFKEYQKKLRSYQGEAKANETIKEALYILSIGTNDFIENYYTMPRGRSSEFSVEQYEDFLLSVSAGFVYDIYRLGARKINLAGIPPMGCLPLERETNFRSITNCNEEYNKVARDFNSKLQGMMQNVQLELADAKLVYSNLYELFSVVIANPAAYGYENSRSGCCASGLFETSYICRRISLTCNDPDKYVFWDAIHPTQRMYQFIASSLMKSCLYVFK